MRSTKPKHHKDPALILFGRTVRALRKEAGYSQEAFGDLCGIDRSYMGGIERGEHNIALLNILKILSALQTEPSAFFRFMDAPNISDTSIKIRADEEQKALRSKHGKLLETAPKTTDAL
jgi:transcriptional regulator with XRE-family HTH domain